MTRSDIEIADRVIDASGVAAFYEPLLPSGGRPRHIPLRSLLIGILLVAIEGRPLYLTEVAKVLRELPADVQRRLRLDRDPSGKPTVVSYRKVEKLFGAFIKLIDPTPVPSFRGIPDSGREAHYKAAQPPDARAAELDDRLHEVAALLLEASVTGRVLSRSLAVDWTDADSWAHGRTRDFASADPNAAWGRRRSLQPGLKDALYFGYAEQILVAVNDEGGAAVPELVLRVDLRAPNENHPLHAISMLERLVADGWQPGDLLADSAYPHKVGWMVKVRSLGFEPVVDLHPSDLGTQGAFRGAIVADGEFYCPCTPPALLEIRLPAKGSRRQDFDAFDTQMDERLRWRVAPHGRTDSAGYQRRVCPAAQGKVRCPLKPDSLTLPFSRPEVLAPPVSPPPVCTQGTSPRVV